LSLDLYLGVVAACASRAARRGNALGERVSNQDGTRAIELTEVEAHWPIRVRAAQNGVCAAQTTIMCSSIQSHRQSRATVVACHAREWLNQERTGRAN